MYFEPMAQKPGIPGSTGAVPSG